MEKVSEGPSGSEIPIDSCNIGFQLLKKHGWKEGTGLGVSEQGRLEPVEAHWKNNKRGLGAEKVQQKSLTPLKTKTVTALDHMNEQEPPPKKSKPLSKKMRKMLELEKKLKEKEFDRAFFMQFWPDNV